MQRKILTAQPQKLFHSKFRPFVWAGLGVVIAQGAPLGWLAVEYLLHGLTPQESLTQATALYVYLNLATSIAFGIFGYYLGTLDQRFAKSQQTMRAEKQHFDVISRTDHVTGLYNDTGLLEILRKWSSFHRRGGPGGSLIIVGYRPSPLPRRRPPQADEVLRFITEAVARGRRQEDVVARVGPHELALFLPGTPVEGAEFVSRRILSALDDVKKARTDVSLSFYTGVTDLAKFDDARKYMGRGFAAMHAARRKDIAGPVVLRETGEQTEPTGEAAVG